MVDNILNVVISKYVYEHAFVQIFACISIIYMKFIILTSLLYGSGFLIPKLDNFFYLRILAI